MEEKRVQRLKWEWINVYLDPTKSDPSRFHSFIFSKSKVVMSRTQDLHIPWGGGREERGRMCKRKEKDQRRGEKREVTCREEGGI